MPELAALDLTHTLTRLNTPIVMAQGRHDQVAPPSAAERYAESLQAPHKQLVWFEQSAHMPRSTVGEVCCDDGFSDQSGR